MRTQKGASFYFWNRIELFIIYCTFFTVHHYHHPRHGQRAFIFKPYCLPFLTTIIQGAKAAQKRQRNDAKNPKSGNTSQTKTNDAAKNIICSTCKQAFVSFVYPSWCSTTDQPFSIVAYYPCACVSDLNYLFSQLLSRYLVFPVLRNMPQINIPRR